MPTKVIYITERQQAEKAAMGDWTIDVSYKGNHDPHVEYSRTGIVIRAEFTTPCRFLPMPHSLGGDLVKATRIVYSPLVCVEGRCGERQEKTGDVRVLKKWLKDFF